MILSILPHHRTDAILRRKNLDRYDDRDDIRTNLIESYDRIMAFTEKHLPDPFYMEKNQRISIRDKIFREVASNILIHREFLNAFPAKVIIEKNQVQTENSNKPHGHGLIDPNNFTPFPKNPVIAKFFKEIGMADELGSGTRNLFKYVKIYSNNEPQLIEEDIFKMLIPQVTPQVKRKQKILEFCYIPRTREEIQKHININDRMYFKSEILTPLIRKGLLKLTIPDKPTSPKQKYISVKTGEKNERS